jgi:hypothetical protein
MQPDLGVGVPVGEGARRSAASAGPLLRDGARDLAGERSRPSPLPGIGQASGLGSRKAMANRLGFVKPMGVA